MKKIYLLAATAFILWAPIPWLYFGHPSILAGQPLSVYAVALFLGGLSMAASALYSSLQQRMSINTARIYISFFILAFVGAYQFSGLAPSWDCLGKQIYVSVAKAQSGCTTTCTDNDKKPCSGWSACWDKFVSCDASGKDQDGRNCQGCCFSCTVTCPTEEPPPDPTNTPIPTATMTSTPTWTPAPAFTNTFTPTYTATKTLTPTNTATMTFTPSQTPTNTATATFTTSPTPTFTATFTNTPSPTPTNTPSPTPTPLPPVISGQVVCELWGDSGWCRGSESLELKASDPQGYALTISGDLNGVLFSCENTCRIPLPEGVGTAHYIVASTSGRSAAGSSTWQRDSTPPSLEMVLPELDGKNGWYVSNIDVTAKASDMTSGLALLMGSVDQGSSWNAFPIHLTDGIHPITILSRDVAGNEERITNVIQVDTDPPTSKILSPADMEVVHGQLVVSGSLADEMSGVMRGELSLDEGVSWEQVTMKPANAWSFPWDTHGMPNGEYDLLMRGVDAAGNVGNKYSILISVDNDPPSIALTNRWWIWETGRLQVSSNYFPIASVTVTIRDPQNRWPAVVLNLDPNKVPAAIHWDRRFANGLLAPAGQYQVEVIVCDLHALCVDDTGLIDIPVVPTAISTMTSTSSAIPTSSPQIRFTATPSVIIQTQLATVPASESSPEPVQRTMVIPLWQLLGLLGLCLVIAAACLTDPRPPALDRLRETIHLLIGQTEDDLFISKKIK